MRQIEFDTELQDKPFLAVPQEVAAQLPKSGRAKVILFVAEDAEDGEWQAAAYEQFMRENSSEDSVYDKYPRVRRDLRLPLSVYLRNFH
jgi:hypothetical protein